ncbi:MAG: class I SAM-dependent methyltransferase [Planctomycetaceae bacterium]|nr:class I SAM-dependent methyltransferase [Planctomycetaceae bacterium]
MVRDRLVRLLDCLEEGQILIHDGDLHQTFGRTSADLQVADLVIHGPALYQHVALAGGLGFAESYLQGQWSTEDLTGLLRVFARNVDQLGSFEGLSTRFFRAVASAQHALSNNSRLGSRRNIASHYDLSNKFFETFLDPTMMYSSAMFDASDMTLEQASVAKLETICRKLDLRSNDHVLEIGTGWGGFATYAARNFGCRVTTTTISQQQYEYANMRVHREGLSDRITVLQDDYRDLHGSFDKLVSIEMLEAVGHQYYDTFFRQCNELIAPGGRMVLQTITIPEQRYERYLCSVDFIQKYIFPGGCLPSLAAVQTAIGRTTRLRLVTHEDFGLCYARTLSEWRRQFLSRLEDVRNLGFDDRFIRMWDYYLAYCEAAFLERAVGVAQLTWIKN